MHCSHRHLVSVLSLTIFLLAFSSLWAGQDYAEFTENLGQLAGQAANAPGLEWRLGSLQLGRDAAGQLLAAATVRSGTISASLPFNAVSARIRGVFASETSLRLEIRIFQNQTWTEWTALPLERVEVEKESRLPSVAGESFLGGLFIRQKNDGQKLEYRLTLQSTAGQASPLVSEITLGFIDSVVSAVAKNDTTVVTPPATNAKYPKPSVVSRSQWGAKSPTCSMNYCTVNHLGIHHTANQTDYNADNVSECATAVKAIQTYHMNTNGWCDIGYNYLICKTGDIFEGRSGGDDVVGAHDSYNCGSMGTCMMGYYHSPYNQVPTAESLSSLMDLFAWKADQKGIDPYGRDYYDGFGARMDNIYGHRDVSNTACPGDNVYEHMAEIRDGVAARMAGEDPGDPGTPGEIIVDNRDSGYSDSLAWATGLAASDKYGKDYRWISTTPGGTKTATWSPLLDTQADYEVFVWYPAGTNRATNAQFTVLYRGGSKVVEVNQQNGGGQWNSLGVYPMGSASGVVLSNDAESGFVVVADAVKFVEATATTPGRCGLISARASYGTLLVSIMSLFMLLALKRNIG
jgi:hypothetical protein